jgi:hypothetical protein
MGMQIAYGQNDKIEPRIDISYYQTDSNAPFIVVQVRKKTEGRFFPLAGIPVTLFFNEETDSMRMDKVTSNAKGDVRMFLPDRFVDVWNQLDTYEFIATVSSNDSIEEATEAIEINRARLRVSTDTADETRLIRVTIEQKNEEEWVYVSDVEMKIFVKRQFGKLFIGEDYYTSDEAGSIEAEFEGEIPGDAQGILELGCMVEDHENFGNLFAFTNTQWGTPMVDDNTAFNKRTLWATRDKTPFWLLIFPNLAIAGIWGVIIYLFFQIYRIKKISKAPEN